MSRTKLVTIWILFVIITATGLALGVSQFVWKQNSPWNWWIPFLVGIVMNVIGFLADIYSIRSALRNSDHPTSTSREGGIDVNADTADIHGDAAGRDIYNVGGDFIRQQSPTPTAEKDSSDPSKSKLPFVVPYAHNRREFFGRDKKLEQLHAFLMGGNTDEGHIVGLTGMGGIGKTRLAVAYAYLYRNAYPGGVFFVESDVSLTQGFAQIGSYLDSTIADRSVKEQIRVSVNHLRNHPKTLIILDDLVDAAVLNTRISSELVPAALPCRLLFTTRPRDRGLFRTIEVPELPEDAALQLLLRHETRQQVLDPNHSEHEVARAICRILGNLPFALDRTSAHLARFSTVRLADYREELLQRGALAVLDDPRVEMRPEDSPTRHRAAVRATLASQWDALQDDKARRLLRVAGQLPSPVSISTVRLGLLAGLGERDERVFSQLSLALEELERASLVDPITERSQGAQEYQIRLHPLVHEFAREQTPHDQVADFRHQCADRLINTYEDVAILEQHCTDRGVDALQEDLTTALELCSFTTDDRGESREIAATKNRLRSVLRLLKREAHNLRDWDPASHPTFFAQQVHNRAIELGPQCLTSSAIRQLQGKNKPYLLKEWRAGHDSPELERTLNSHDSVVRSIAVTPDGRRLVFAADHTLKVWNLQTGQVEDPLGEHSKIVRDVAITPDGRYCVSASDAGTLKVWNLRTGELEQTIRRHYESAEGKQLKEAHIPNSIYAVAITSDGSRIVSTSSETFSEINIWNLQTGEEEFTLADQSRSGIQALATLSEDQVISISLDHVLTVWDLRRKEVKQAIELSSERTRRPPDPSNTYRVTAMPDGFTAVSASESNPLTIWNLRTGRGKLAPGGSEGWVHTVAIRAHESRIISASTDYSLKVWDLNSGELDRVLRGHSAEISALVVTPDGHRLISASEDHTLKVWDISTESQGDSLAQGGERIPSGHVGDVFAVAITPDGHRAVSASLDCTLKVWRLREELASREIEGPMSEEGLVLQQDELLELPEVDADTPDFSYDSNREKNTEDSAESTRSIKREMHTLTGHIEGVRALAMAPDGHKIISASLDRTSMIWNLLTGTHEHTLRGHKDPLRGVAIANVPRIDDALPHFRAISASEDRSLRVWGFQGRETWNLIGEEQHTLQGHGGIVYAVAMTRDARWAVSASQDTKLKIWDVETGQELRTLSGHESSVCTVAVTWNGRQIVSGSQNGTLKVWDLETGQEKYSLRGHDSTVTDVAVTRDGHRAVSASRDPTLKVWDLYSGRLEHTLDGHTGEVYAVTVTLDGRRAASVSSDHTLKVWDIQNGVELATVALEGKLWHVAVAPNGRTIVTGDGAGNIYCLRYVAPNESLNGRSNAFAENKEITHA